MPPASEPYPAPPREPSPAPPAANSLDSTKALYHYLLGCPPLAPPIAIFKGGGYIYGDAENLLKASRLSHVFQMTNKISGADAVVCRAQWDDKRTVDLRGHQNAASNHGIPFIVLERFTPSQLLLRLRPLLEARGVVPPLERQLLYRRTVLEDGDESSEAAESVARETGSWSSPGGVQDPARDPAQLEQMQMQVLSGEMTTGEYIRVGGTALCCSSA